MILLLAISTMIWYVIDRFKPLWETFEYSSAITTAIALVLSAFCVFGLNLDLLNIAALTETITIIGRVITVLLLTSGSSAIAEIIDKIHY